MRIERQKRAKKWMTRYRAVHHYVEPLQVLVDPPLLTAALIARVFLREELPHAFQARAVPVVTTCVLAYLRAQAAKVRRGDADATAPAAGDAAAAAAARPGRLTPAEALAQAAVAARRLERVECGHARALCPRACILDVLRREDEQCKAAARAGTAPPRRRLAAAVQDDQTRFAVRRIGVVPLACFPVSEEKARIGHVGTLVMLEPTDKLTRSKTVVSREYKRQQRQQQVGRHYLALKRRLGLIPTTATPSSASSAGAAGKQDGKPAHP